MTAATTTLIGNTTADVELRYTQSGRAVASVTIAVSDRVKDKTTSEWVDGNTWFARCTLWGELAEHAASSISKGTRVIGEGRIQQREWEDKEGNKRTSVEVVLEEIGPSLRYATAQLTRTSSGGGNSGGQRQQSKPADEPWGQSAGQGASGWATPGQAQGGDDLPPF